MQRGGHGGRFEFIAGAVSLDLLDTVANRASTPHETLTANADVRRWCEAAGFGKVDKPDIVSAHELRRAIEDLVKHLPVSPSDRTARIIDAFAARPNIAPRLKSGNTTVGFEAVLSTIARDAIAVASGDLAGRVRQCAGCAMWFVDRSRPGTRQWCSSTNKCGNRARLRRHRSSTTKEK